MQTIEIEIRNPNGLHLRPLGQFVRTCGRVKSDVTIQNLASGAGPANAKQMLRVQPLGIRMGHVVRITVEGEDEVEAAATIRAAIEAGLGEEVPADSEVAQVAPSGGAPAPAAPAPAPATPAPAPATPAPAPAAARAPAPGPVRLVTVPSIAPAPAGRPSADPGARRLRGVGGVAGIASAPAWRYREQPAAEAPSPAGGPLTPGVAETPSPAGGRQAARVAAVPGGPTAATDPAVAIRAASRAAETQLEELASRIREAGRPDDAGIFEAQAVLATDPTIVDTAIERAGGGADPAAAVVDAATEAALAIAGLGDELLAARAADVRDVGARIARILRGERLALPDAPVVAVADDLPPSVTAEIPAAFLRGIVLAGGSRTAHAVILARSLGIPCVVGCGGLLEAVDDAATAGGPVLDRARR